MNILAKSPDVVTINSIIVETFILAGIWPWKATAVNHV